MFRLSLCCTLSGILIFGPTFAQAGIRIRSSVPAESVATTTGSALISAGSRQPGVSSSAAALKLTGRRLQSNIDASITTATTVLKETDRRAQQGKKLIGNARRQLDGGRRRLEDVRDDVKTGARVLKTTARLSKSVAKKLESKSGVLKKASRGLKSLSGKAASGAKMFSGGASTLKSGLRRLAGGSAQLKAGSRQLAKVSLGSQQAQSALQSASRKTGSLLSGLGKSSGKPAAKGLLSSAQKSLTHQGAKSFRRLAGSKSGQKLLARAISGGNLPTSPLSKLSSKPLSKPTLKSPTGKGLLKKSKLLKSGSKFLKGGALGVVAEDVVGIDPFKVGRDVLTKPSNIVKALAPRNIDRHLQKQAKNLNDNYLKFGHVKKGLDGIDRLTQGRLSRTAEDLDRLSGGHLGKAGKTVGKTWNTGIDGVGKVASGGYKGVRKGVDTVAKEVDKAGKAVGKGAKAAGKGLAKAGKSIGGFVGGLFKTKK